MDAVPFVNPPIGVPLVVVQADVGGQLANVVLDTGAAAPFTVLISPDLAKRTGAQPAEGPAIAAKGAVGDQGVAMTPATLPEFRLGPIALHNTRVGVMPSLEQLSQRLGMKIDAVIGSQFLAGRTISIDYGLKQVDFQAADGPPASAIPFDVSPKKPVILVKVAINDRGPFQLVLDTGASATLLTPATAKAAGLELGATAAIAGAGGAAGGGAKLGRGRLSFGGVVRDNQPMAVADVLGAAQTEAGARIDGALGATFFSHCRITLDYASNRLWIETEGH